MTDSKKDLANIKILREDWEWMDDEATRLKRSLRLTKYTQDRLVSDMRRSYEALMVDKDGVAAELLEAYYQQPDGFARKMREQFEAYRAAKEKRTASVRKKEASKGLPHAAEG